MVGRYMVVHIPGNDKILSLAEVGVYGDLAGNVCIAYFNIESNKPFLFHSSLKFLNLIGQPRHNPSLE